MKNCLSIILICVVVLLSAFGGTVECRADTPAGTVLFDGIGDGEPTYFDYMQSNVGIPAAENTYSADIGSGVLSETGRSAVFEITVRESALYNLETEYTALPGKNAAIEREIRINGESPFREAQCVSFERAFKDETEIRQNSLGNDIVPVQIEASMTLSKRFSDSSGYYSRPYEFYLKEGINIITLTGIKESMQIISLSACPPQKLPSYNEVRQSYTDNGYKAASAPLPMILAQTASLKSTHTLVPTFDRSSPSTVPYSASKLRLNTIGADKWKTPGMWIEWTVDVTESALYQLNFKYRQNLATGITVFRKLSIDGKVPFEEAMSISFKYSRTWDFSSNCSDEYLYYLEKGVHTIRLEAVLADMGDVLRAGEELLYDLNALYREIIMITGVIPDIYRDYKIERRIEELPEKFNELNGKMRNLISLTDKISGGKNSISVMLNSFLLQLDTLSDDPEMITGILPNYKENIVSLGAVLSQIRETPLELDYILVSPPGEKPPKANGTVLQKIKHELTAFVLSFFEDYNSLGSKTGEEYKKITVWVASGREQANILKTLIDSGFADQNINVDLKLVPGALLQATIAGKAPDAALNLGQSEPVNYAMRNALCDLTGFDEFREAADRFNSGALTPFAFNGGIYALPETESFYMLFYRKDVLQRLNITPPQTWEEMYNILPVLNRNNMEFGLPSNINTFATLLYQNGGAFYLDDHSASMLNSLVSLKSFTSWTNLYTSYRLPVEFDFANRFRTGEMPMAIVDYTMFNMLSAFAPELRGFWDFCEIPGKRDPSTGVIDRTTVNGVSGSVIMGSSKNQNEAWKFLKWWLSGDVQSQYASKTESVLGESARYAAANIEARQSIAWPAESLKKLNNQAEWVRGIPEVAGGYFTSRHIDNAFKSVINSGSIPTDTLNNYVRIINSEISAKRRELGIEGEQR